jgi:DnaK suppressor protein
MNGNELIKYRKTLETKRAEISGALRNRGDIAVEKTPDLLEEVQLAADRDMVIHNLHRESGLLRQVQAALARIADGSYGVCQHCEEEIKPRRLEAVPWTAYCVRCQEAIDRQEIEPAATLPPGSRRGRVKAPEQTEPCHAERMRGICCSRVHHHSRFLAPLGMTAGPYQVTLPPASRAATSTPA